MDETPMKALAMEGFDGPPRVIEVAAPPPGPGEVLVRVRAASVNAYDTFVTSGMMKDYMPYEFPAVAGMDIAGVVEGAGDGVDDFAPGIRVFGTMGMKGTVHDGSFGELATPQAQSLTIAPDALDDVQAGALGVAGTTAVSAVEAVDPADGDVILVIGATGGVGSFAIQLAAMRGARVVASVRPGDEAFVQGLGAADTVDYTGDVDATIRARYPDGIAGLIDLVNREHAAFMKVASLVRDGGHATSAVGGAGDATETGGVAVSNVGGNPGHLGPLASLVVAGSVRGAIRRTYGLADAAQALEDFTDQHTLGKLVITVP
jgi:NADPH:quinone reductase-like Zn-dependent oxidoreductase